MSKSDHFPVIFNHFQALETSVRNKEKLSYFQQMFYSLEDLLQRKILLSNISSSVPKKFDKIQKCLK